MITRPYAVFAALGVALLFVAWAAPDVGRLTDRPVYEATAERFIVHDCSDLHCFRVLVPWVLGSLPGPSIVKWKIYAVAANLAGAIGVYALSLAWGLSARGAVMASVLSALGFGGLYTLFDPFTGDPLMYAAGPVLVWLTVNGRLALAGLCAAVAVMAKEFAAAPMLILAAATAAAGKWTAALRMLAYANIAVIVWLSLQLVLTLAFNYSYAGSSSTQLLHGGYLAVWLERISLTLAVMAIYGVFGALWLLAPIGLWSAAPPIRRVAIAAIPVALLFAYVQQPDRALWNFHFIITPLAAMVLERAPAPAAWTCIGAFALANLRLGAQLTFIPASRVALVVSAVMAVVCVFWMQRRPAAVAA